MKRDVRSEHEKVFGSMDVLFSYGSGVKAEFVIIKIVLINDQGFTPFTTNLKTSGCYILKHHYVTRLCPITLTIVCRQVI
jgi:hypothetical protein